MFLIFTAFLYAQNSEEEITISPDSTKEEIIAFIKSNMAKSGIEFDKGNYLASILYNHKNLELAKKIGDSLLLAMSRSYIANDYLKLDNISSTQSVAISGLSGITTSYDIYEDSAIRR